MPGILEIMNHSVFLWPVAGCAGVSFAITLERSWFLFMRASVAPAPFMADIQRCILAGDLDKAIRICSSEPRAPLANVVKAALRNANEDREDLTLAVEQAILDATPEVQRRVGYLATLANVVTLFGLLGTIIGLIVSFQGAAEADLADKQTKLAEGIAMAMYTTAGGISVAIPTLAAYSILVQRGNGILDDVERYGMKVLMLLQARKKAPPVIHPGTVA